MSFVAGSVRQHDLLTGRPFFPGHKHGKQIKSQNYERALISLEAHANTYLKHLIYGKIATI